MIDSSKNKGKILSEKQMFAIHLWQEIIKGLVIKKMTGVLSDLRIRKTNTKRMF